MKNAENSSDFAFLVNIGPSNGEVDVCFLPLINKACSSKKRDHCLNDEERIFEREKARCFQEQPSANFKKAKLKWDEVLTGPVALQGKAMATREDASHCGGCNTAKKERSRLWSEFRGGA